MAHAPFQPALVFHSGMPELRETNEFLNQHKAAQPGRTQRHDGN
jgi:hypothetical protein